MSQLLPVAIEGDEIYIEVDDAYGLEETTSLDDVVERTARVFERTKSVITGVAKSLVQTVNDLDDTVKPDEFSLEFAIKFNGEGNAIVAKISGEGNLKVNLKYKR